VDRGFLDAGARKDILVAAGTCNQPPLADTGPSQTVAEGTTVVLDASGSSEPEGAPLSYFWRQITGPTVLLDLIDPIHPSFVAPGVPAPGATLTFELVVSDGQQASVPSVVNVTVNAARRPGLIVGVGRLDVGGMRHSIAFAVRASASRPPRGFVTVLMTTRLAPHGRFVASAITEAFFSDDPAVTPGPQPPSGMDTVEFSGVGKWNGAPGYTFEARSVDAGESGRSQDAFAITVKDPLGATVLTVSGTLSRGNIQSLIAKP
jgi:hypothetical protein